MRLAVLPPVFLFVIKVIQSCQFIFYPALASDQLCILIVAPFASQMNMVLCFAALSAIGKLCEMVRPQFANQSIARCRGCVPNAYLSLNHRYMNKKWREEEEELEKFL